MTDPAARLRRARDLFDAVADLAPAERAEQLARLTGDDAVLRREVEELLAIAESSPSLVLSPASFGNAAPSGDASSLIGAHLGAYDVVGLVGVGGMGAVYEAARSDAQYHKRVAIKVVQRDLNSDLAIARFRRERQILASLDHPNIATLLDGGLTPDGRPYLVMEYVEGAPLTTWCNERSLSIRDRVALFRQVCAAVQQAHRALVIHRDLKPANILVTGDGLVKLLDFGIATFAAGGDDGEMPLTRGGARAFTPEYASPEQIRGAPLTTASDVYSLGVVLFELLSGRRPHQVSSRALVDIERAVLDTPVPRPSSVVTGEAARHVGERTPERLRQRLKGELDSVTLAALQADPAKRYRSVEALDDDLRRYLEGLPVRAQPSWIGYRARKFVQRNRAAVAASGLVLVALLGGGVATAVQVARTRHEEAREVQVDRFLRGLLSSVQPEVGRRDVPMSEVLDSASRRLGADLSDQPDVRAALESVIGQSYEGLSRFAEAETHFNLALALQRRVSGPASDDVAARLSDLAELYMGIGTLDSAKVALTTALEIKRHNSSHPDSLYGSLLNDLGVVAYGQGHLADAERLHREAFAVQKQVLNPHNDVLASTMANIGMAAAEQGRPVEAESLERAAVAMIRGNHPGPTIALADEENALAGVLDIQGKTAAADSAYRETLEIRRKLLGPEHPDYAMVLLNYSMFIFDQQRYREAAEDSRALLALRGKTLPESHPAIAASLQTLGRSLDKVGDPAGAERSLIESLELRRKYNDSGSWIIASSEGVLGEHYALMKEYPKAESLMLHAQGVLVASHGMTNPRTQANLRRLVVLYTAWHKPEEAAKYQSLIVRP